jgi:serine/threonine-protein kinase
MNSQSAQQAAGIFHAVCALPADERAAFVDRECAGNDGLRAEVLALLVADEEASREGFLEAGSRKRATSGAVDSASLTQSRVKPRVPVEIPVSLVVGSEPDQASAVESLYRSRMRAGILIILVGFGGFLAKNLLTGKPYADPDQWPILWAHIAIVVSAALTAPFPLGRLPLSLRGFRSLELFFLFLITVFFALYQVDELRRDRWASEAAPGYEADVIEMAADGCALRWFASLVFYGFFVPNTWRRCAGVLGVVAICPIAVTLGVGLWENTLGLLSDALQEMSIWAGLGWAMAVYGSHKITQLRREVAEARKLGQYRLTRRLGIGGMGEVWLAEHHLLKRPCAIKLIRSELVGDPATLSRFQREVRATAMLAHPNAVRIYDYGVADDGTFYYTMEYLPGLTLQELVEKNGPLPPERAIYLLRQACSALGEAHRLGLVHRDLKPGNLIACPLGGVPDVLKVLDFGLVRNIRGEREQEGLSLDDCIIGTPDYLSPEQASGQPNVDARSDIYSLGAVGYFLLSARPPFEGRTYHHVLVAHLEESPQPFAALGKDVPADLEVVILRCLEKNPADRFADAKSLADALADCACASAWSESKAARWWAEHPLPEVALEHGAVSQGSH